MCQSLVAVKTFFFTAASDFFLLPQVIACQVQHLKA
jgi:hypothetical protein